MYLISTYIVDNKREGPVGSQLIRRAAFKGSPAKKEAIIANISLIFTKIKAKAKHSTQQLWLVLWVVITRRRGDIVRSPLVPNFMYETPFHFYSQTISQYWQMQLSLSGSQARHKVFDALIQLRKRTIWFEFY